MFINIIILKKVSGYPSLTILTLNSVTLLQKIVLISQQDTTVFLKDIQLTFLTYCHLTIANSGLNGSGQPLLNPPMGLVSHYQTHPWVWSATIKPTQGLACHYQTTRGSGLPLSNPPVGLACHYQTHLWVCQVTGFPRQCSASHYFGQMSSKE
ncbi:hypothetical protein BsWGS_07089 [Bradybaena similaris]